MLRRIVALWPFAFWVAYGLMARGYGIGRVTQPGPGAFPLAVAVAGVLTSIVTVVAGRTPATTSRPERQGRRGGREVLLAAIMLGSIPAASLVGMVPVVFLVTVAVARLMGLRAGWALVATGAGVTVAVYFVFAVWLGVPIGTGSLFR